MVLYHRTETSCADLVRLTFANVETRHQTIWNSVARLQCHHELPFGAVYPARVVGRLQLDHAGVLRHSLYVGVVRHSLYKRC